MLHIPVLQVDEVLQVELSGVLGQIDGVHILGGGGAREMRGNSFNTKLNSTAAEKHKTNRQNRLKEDEAQPELQNLTQKKKRRWKKNKKNKHKKQLDKMNHMRNQQSKLSNQY